MRKFLTGFLALTLIVPLVGAREVRTDPSIEVTAGVIEQDGMLGTSGGEVFLEFSNGVRFLNALDRTMFSGEILPPAVIPLPVASPRTRMDELVTFELVADTGTEVSFADSFDTLHPRNQLREQYLNPELSRDGWVQLLMPVEDELIQEPKLWEFLGEDEGWLRIGGRTEPTEYDDVFIFIAKISRTGVYGIFDENPLPSTYATDWEVLTEESGDIYDPAGIDFEPENIIPAFITDDPTLEYSEGSDAEFIVDVDPPIVTEENERQVEAVAPLANQKISPMSPNYGDPAFVPEPAPIVTLTDPVITGDVTVDYTPGTGDLPGDGGAVTLLDPIESSDPEFNPLTAPDPQIIEEEITPLPLPSDAMLPSTGADDGERASGWMIVVLGSVMFVLGASVLLAFKKPAHRS